MDLKQQPDGTLIGRSSCPSDTSACPRCGHFFSQGVDGRCPTCAANEATETARQQATEAHRRAETHYQRAEAAESTVRQHEHTIRQLKERIEQLEGEVRDERETHLEHLETIIVRIAGARK